MLKFGLHASSAVVPDLAFSLTLPPAAEPEAAVTRPFIAVAAISDRALTSRVASAHDSYVACLADACRLWLARGSRIRFVCSQPQMDLPVIERIVALLPPVAAGAGWEVSETTTVESYIEAVQGAEMVVASRLHGLILALLTETPVIAIAANRKVIQLMSDVGLTGYMVQLEGLSAVALTEIVERIRERRGELKQVMVAFNNNARQTLASLYDRVAALVNE
jgi:polysaccharide pyruvyl transferase WcaK-like protein